MSRIIARPRISPNTLAHESIRVLRRYQLADVDAIEIISQIIAILEKPDAEMLEAGIAELQHALPPGSTKTYQKDLARCLWRAMLARVAQ